MMALFYLMVIDYVAMAVMIAASFFHIRGYPYWSENPDCQAADSIMALFYLMVIDYVAMAVIIAASFFHIRGYPYSLLVEFISLPDRTMESKNGKIILILDQCAAHTRQATIHNVKLVFLPANTTAHRQLLHDDDYVISNAKHYFNGLLVCRLFAKIDRKDGDLRISLLDAIHFGAMARYRVMPVTIANCFNKCGCSRSPTKVPPEPEDPDISDWDQLDAGCSMHDFITADDNLTTCGACTVEDILNEATSEAANSTDDKGNENGRGNDEQPPLAAKTLHTLDILRRAMATEGLSNDTCAHVL
ncbi:hypothetical protein HPB49_004139 [Dermacentor silvarum]|uniref:Uncharacterized protein n=1 Tax=Dermacentor silvarum TaxID=543639 RepID=A0ACB8D2K8_DERSI|nr:hypothetical protein HPB49_004139 [Dermacentor silvarum]